MKPEEQVEKSYERDAIPLLGSISRAVGGDRQLAEDVAQESWLRAILYWPTHGVPDRPGAWLRTVSRNILLNNRRGRTPVRLDDVAPGALGVPSSEATLDASEQRTMLHAAVADLPPDARHLVESHYFNGQSMADIAHHLALSERAVEGRMRRIRIRLRAVLEARGITGAELRGLSPSIDPSLLTLGKALLVSTLLPFLMAFVIYFVARRLVARQSDRQRDVGKVLGGFGLIALATLEAPDPRGLQILGLSLLLYGAWRLWKHSPGRSSV